MMEVEGEGGTDCSSSSRERGGGSSGSDRIRGNVAKGRGAKSIITAEGVGKGKRGRWREMRGKVFFGVLLTRGGGGS